MQMQRKAKWWWILDEDLSKQEQRRMIAKCLNPDGFRQGRVR
jgi:hypothetical protein